jgi:two-component system chemotaxis response regulator CheY
MKKEILIIDSEPTILELLGFILSEDYQIILKPSCYDALFWLENRMNPSLILLDPEMPYFDGKAFIKSLKVSGLYRNIPIVLLTTKKESLSLLDIQSDTIEGCINKPFNPIRLKEKIVQVLQNQQNRYELERFYN